jgi:hypothetical protein
VLARISDGVDTNACASDWIVTEEATPGASNPDHDPVVCIEGAQNIKINEFMVDPDAWLVGEDVTDSELEWVELFNASDAAVSVAGWQIQWGKSGSYSGSKVFAADATLGPGAYMLVGGSLVDGTDATASFDMGNAGSNSDALRLVDCADAVQDTVVYGPNNDDGWLDDEDEVATSFAESPGKEKSSARAVNGVDSNQSGTDFVVSDSPTPGDLNVLPDPDEEADEGASDDGGASGDGGASDDGGPFDPGEWSSSDTGEDWDVDDTKSGCMGCASTRTRPNIWWCVFPILAFARRRRLAATTRS